MKDGLGLPAQLNPDAVHNQIRMPEMEARSCNAWSHLGRLYWHSALLQLLL
jgi:hypothetical protein